VFRTRSWRNGTREVQGEALHYDPCTVAVGTKAKALAGLARSDRGQLVQRRAQALPINADSSVLLAASLDHSAPPDSVRITFNDL